MSGTSPTRRAGGAAAARPAAADPAGRSKYSLVLDLRLRRLTALLQRDPCNADLYRAVNHTLAEAMRNAAAILPGETLVKARHALARARKQRSCSRPPRPPSPTGAQLMARVDPTSTRSRYSKDLEALLERATRLYTAAPTAANRARLNTLRAEARDHPDAVVSLQVSTAADRALARLAPSRAGTGSAAARQAASPVVTRTVGLGSVPGSGQQGDYVGIERTVGAGARVLTQSRLVAHVVIGDDGLPLNGPGGQPRISRIVAMGQQVSVNGKLVSTRRPQYVVRDAQGQPITDPAKAAARVREWLQHGAISGWQALSRGATGSPEALSAAAVNRIVPFNPGRADGYRPNGGTGQPIGRMTLLERWAYTIRVAAARMPPEMGQRVRDLANWQTLAGMAAYAGSHAVGAGWLADGLLLPTMLKEGRDQLERARQALLDVRVATHMVDLDRAAADLARALAPLAVDGSTAVTMAGAARAGRRRIRGAAIDVDVTASSRSMPPEVQARTAPAAGSLATPRPSPQHALGHSPRHVPRRTHVLQPVAKPKAPPGRPPTETPAIHPASSPQRPASTPQVKRPEGPRSTPRPDETPALFGLWPADGAAGQGRPGPLPSPTTLPRGHRLPEVGEIQARVGPSPVTPWQTPEAATGAFESAQLLHWGGRAAVGTAANALVNQRLVAPTQALLVRGWEKFSSTPAGQLVSAVSGAASSRIAHVTADGTPVGNTLAFLDRHLVRNEPLWNAVGKVGDAGRRLTQIGFAGLMASLATAHANGTLKVASFVTDGRRLTPEQAEIVRAINVPRNMHVTYFLARSETPVTIDGKTYRVPARSFAAVAGGRNVVLLPATGLGKPGAQPWIGYDTNSRRLTIASSSVASAGWALVGFSSGSTNFNTSGRIDLQALRGLWNAVAFTTGPDRPDALSGPSTSKLKTILIADPLSTFFTTTVNAGPLAFVVERYRHPQSERVTIPDGVALTTDPHSSRVVPAFPLVGAATFDPAAQDWKLLGGLFEAALERAR